MAPDTHPAIFIGMFGKVLVLHFYFIRRYSHWETIILVRSDSCNKLHGLQQKTTKIITDNCVYLVEHTWQHWVKLKYLDGIIPDNKMLVIIINSVTQNFHQVFHLHVGQSLKMTLVDLYIFLLVLIDLKLDHKVLSIV